MTFIFLFIGYQLPKEIGGIIFTTLPWGDRVTLSEADGNTWFLFWLVVPVVSIYIFIACIRQFRRGERQEAVMLCIGLLFLSIAIIFDTLIDMGLVNFFYISDFGFLPMAIVMSLQLSNKMVEIQKKLSQYQLKLENIVDERTSQLKISNEKLAQELIERQQVEKSLQKSERQTRALLDAPSDIAMLITIAGEILATNQIGASRFGLSVDETIGKNLFDFFDQETAAFRKNQKDKVVQKKLLQEWEDQRTGRYFRNRMYPILGESDEVESIAIFAADITEQKRLQAKEMESAAVEERNRLARDLHDAVTQTIYSASLIAEVLPQVWERDPNEGRRNLTKLRALVRGALAEMRTMLFELRPTALEAANFETLLEQLGDALHGRTRIPVQIECDEIPDLIPSVKVGFYRIAQEAINNIIKHSKATQIQIELRKRSGEVLLRISDNGCGFDPAKTSHSGLGLEIMQERAKNIQANLEIDSQINQGTQITAQWMAPVQNENEV